jgi:Cys-rich peptide (TIGR04165 family)
MKAEELGQKCPKCGCTDKAISKKRNPEDSKEIVDAVYIQHIPSGNVGVIRCSDCGHIFEYCKDREPPIKVKKITL